MIDAVGARRVLLALFALAGCREASPPRTPSVAEIARTQPDAAVIELAPGKLALPELTPTPEEADDPFPDAGPGTDVRMVLKVLPADAEVFWGARRLGLAKRGEPLEIVRPQHSGPLDLVIKAPGFFVHHTRLFPGENVTVEMVRLTQGAGLPGWRSERKP